MQKLYKLYAKNIFLFIIFKSKNKNPTNMDKIYENTIFL